MPFLLGKLLSALSTFHTVLYSNEMQFSHLISVNCLFCIPLADDFVLVVVC